MPAPSTSLATSTISISASGHAQYLAKASRFDPFPEPKTANLTLFFCIVFLATLGPRNTGISGPSLLPTKKCKGKLEACSSLSNFDREDGSETIQERSDQKGSRREFGR